MKANSNQQKPVYFFLSNWDGKKVEHTSLRALKKKASQETGVAISIFGPGFHEIVPASGHCPI